jgi:hypothetical protein
VAVNRTKQERLDRANVDAPTGYKFKVQLVDAPSIVDARQEVAEMFGQRVADAAVIRPGSERCIKHATCFEFVPQYAGFTVYVPEQL